MIYTIRHTYKPKVILPYVGIENNISFALDKDERIIVTADNIRCKAINVKVSNVFKLEQDIQHIYGCDAWSWLKRWHELCPALSSIEVLVMELKQIS